MIRPFLFKPTTDESGINWAILSQNTNFREFTPTITGFTGSYTPLCYSLLYGPVAHIFILITGTFKWGSYSTIDIPIEPWVPTNGSFPQELNPIINHTAIPSIAADKVVNGEYPMITSGPNNVGRITLVTAYSALTDLTSVKLTGMFIRN